MTIQRTHQVTTISHFFSVFMLTIALLALPTKALATTLEWSPLSIDFGQVPYGTTAYQTLTLTNIDEVEVITINSVEFTFNLMGQFGFETSRPLPAILPPSGDPASSMEVVFSFTPTEISFSQTDVLITSDSTNKPILDYYLFGEMAQGGDPCYPLTSCSGLCVDLMTDVANCGTCDNVCLNVVNGTVACEYGSCTFTCDNGYEPSGDECVLIGPDDPLLMLQELIVYANQAIEDGTLIGWGPGSGPDSAAQHRLDAFMGQLQGRVLPTGEEVSGAIDYLSVGLIPEAFGALNLAQLRCDGGWPFRLPPDWVAGEAAYVIHEGLIDILLVLQEQYPDLQLIISEPITRPDRS